MTIKIRTANQLLALVDGALLWLASRGGPDHGRFVEYRRQLQMATDEPGNGRRIVEWEVGGQRQFFAAASEIFDLLEIATLHDDVVRTHLDKIRMLAAGSTFYDEVVPSDQDQGRDSAFELLTAAAMQRAGAVPTLEAPADVRAIFPDFEAHIECKRPKTAAGFGRQIQRASQQFNVHRANGVTGIGVVAIDLTRLINPGLGILPSRNRAAATDALHQITTRKMTELHREVQLEQIHTAGQIDVLLVRATAMTINESEARPEVATVLQIYPQGPTGSAAHQRALAFSHAYQRAGQDRLGAG